MAQVVYTAANGTSDLHGSLFEGIKFWLSQKVPQRSRFIEEIQSNGGSVVPLEKQADVKIVDHARKEQIPGTHSYTFIETSIRKGTLEDLADHAVGSRPGTVRSVGSVVQPAKATRRKFTAAEDLILWDWVNTNPQKGGGTEGNEIYKQLERKYPQHTFQSWRDRYIKKIKGQPRPSAIHQNGPPTPPSEPYNVNERRQDRAEEAEIIKEQGGRFSEEDVRTLNAVGNDIENIRADRKNEAWVAWVQEIDPESRHSAREWQDFWERHVRPRFLANFSKKRPPSKDRTSNDTRPPEIFSPRASDPHIDLEVTSPAREETMIAENRKKKQRAPNVEPASRLPSSLKRLSPPSDTRDTSEPADVVSLSITHDKSPKNPQELPSVLSAHLARPSKRKRTEAPSRRREIPSTPDGSPSHRHTDRHSPLFFGSDEDFDMMSGAKPETGNVLLQSGANVGYEHILKGDMSDSFSERNQTRQDTQAFSREPTPFIDFEVPPPDEGWDNEEPLEVRIKNEHEMEEAQAYRSQTPDTHGLLNGLTQLPDFAVPDPDGGWHSLADTQSQDLPGTVDKAESIASSGELNAQVDEWIESFVAKGFTIDEVEAVLKSTSLDSRLAEDVLGYVLKGKKKGNGEDPFQVPDDWRGVWTDKDDDDLYATDARIIGKLHEKHGQESLKARWEFLDYSNAS
ncbi:uncharacterized protein KY384_002589 [Bacidia gigantensis]|uniref:uncharacterized protein n=1 Tax=Bacidia gigantensis TaxID=2732470 RepID=UPI001D04A28C|nr:uncharacterized protein KY384_002589 [Bacidia gigantensis]KAG8532712.1 hypothetical protein KY384_002589 [Bacidia gigantensis]